MTPKGKRIPLDVKPQKRIVIYPDPIESITSGGPNAGFTFTGGGFEEHRVAVMVDTYMPHHATCPAVERFRRAKSGG